jgi:ADP-ribosylarginine hydrolase
MTTHPLIANILINHLFIYRSYFHDRWRDYLKSRHIFNGDADPVFPKVYGIQERDDQYKKWSWSGWGGSSGHDAPMIA